MSNRQNGVQISSCFLQRYSSVSNNRESLVSEIRGVLTAVPLRQRLATILGLFASSLFELIGLAAMAWTFLKWISPAGEQ
jgi:hypothetical protein